jgi:tetratricopeptide (TPR) repeat protein
MIKFIFKKILGKKEEPKEEPLNSKIAISLREKSKEFSDFLFTKIGSTKEEISVIRTKFKNLLETNYSLGLKHIERGHIPEAIFRFRFIKKFWPHHYDSYYFLAYCLALKRKKVEARKILEELFIKNPNYDQKAKDLLDHLKSSVENEDEKK